MSINYYAGKTPRSTMLMTRAWSSNATLPIWIGRACYLGIIHGQSLPVLRLEEQMPGEKFLKVDTYISLSIVPLCVPRNKAIWDSLPFRSYTTESPHCPIDLPFRQTRWQWRRRRCETPLRASLVSSDTSQRGRHSVERIHWLWLGDDEYSVLSTQSFLVLLVHESASRGHTA